MSVETDPLNPPPHTTKPIDSRTEVFVQLWAQWFTALREKINVINTSLQNLAGLVSGGIVSSDGSGAYTAREIQGTAGNIDVANGDGVAGDPTIDLADISPDPSGTYGDATHVAQVEVDEKGRVVSVTEVAISGGGGGSTMLASDTLAAAGTTLTIATSSFDLSSEGRLRLVFKGKNNTGSDAGYIMLYCNTDTTNSNYYSQLGVFQGAGASAARQNDASLCYLYNAACFEGGAVMSLDLDGKCRILTHIADASPSASTVYYSAIYYTSATNVTGLKLIAPANLAVGSTLEVWTY